jgi:hypothetical protein
MLQIVNDNGRKFNVRAVCEGGEYGLNDCLIHDGAPMVEFYDASYADPNGPFGERGQFVSRYYLKSLEEGPMLGVCLDGGNRDVWNINAQNQADACAYVREVAEAEGALY